MSKKSGHITEVVTMTNMLARYYSDKSTEIHKAYFDNEYGSGGANEITDADIQSVFPDLTVADFTGAINLMAQVNNLMGNNAVSQADWLSTVNKVRIHGVV